MKIFRSLIRGVSLPGLLVALLLVGYTPRMESVVVQLKQGELWLEIPDEVVKVEANTTTQLSAKPVNFIKLHIARPSSEINYGTIHTRINTEAADTLMTTTGTTDGIICNLDLMHHGGFELTKGRNSLEVAYMDRFNRLHYGSFLLDRGSRTAAREAVAVGPPVRLTGQKYAVVIGVARYKNSGSGLVNLRYADRDADTFRTFLESPGGGSFPKENVTTLLNEDATSDAVRTALFTFLSKPRPEDLVVIYFAGHGSPDPNDSRNLYFLTYDTDLDNMGGTAFPMFGFQDVFERVLKARRVITLVDSCHSFGISGEKNMGIPRNNLVNQYVQRFASSGERAVLTASDTSELSYEDPKWGGGHGVFTYYLLKGMSHDADSNHDGTVTVGELAAFLRKNVSGDTAGQQNPQAIMGGVGSTPVSTVGREVATVRRVHSAPGD